MENPLVGIVLINWNGINYTLRCLESLNQCTYDRKAIYVVDNASDQDQVHTLSTTKGINLIALEQNLGFTGANNKGIDRAISDGCDYVMILNNDTEVKAGFIEPMLKVFDRHPLAGAVQPMIYHLEERERIWNAGGTINKWTFFPNVIGSLKLDKGEYSSIKKIDWATGCCILASRDAWLKSKGLDDKYFFLFEDVDWSLSIRKLKFEIYFVPDSMIYHAVSVSTTSEKKTKEGFINPKRHYQNIRNHLFLVRKHVGRYNFVSVYLVQFTKWTFYILYFLARGRFQKLKYALLGIKDGLLK